MRKSLIKIVISFVFITFFIGSSCDDLSQLTLNVPLVIEFISEGPNTTSSDEEFFCLSSYEEWRDNQEDIESAKYLAASYWTLEGEDFSQTTPNLRGNVSFSLFESGIHLFTVSFGNITAADYLENPYVLELNESDVQALDDILLNLAGNDACFTSTLNVTNITGDTNASGDYVLNGKVEIVLETEVAL